MIRAWNFRLQVRVYIIIESCPVSRVHRLYVITSRSKSIEGRKTKGIDDPRLYARGIVSQEHPRGETSDDDDMRERDTGGDSDGMSMDGTRGWKDSTTVYYPSWCKRSML